MTDKLLCPFCNKPLQPTLRQSDEYWCENYDCSGTNIEWVGSQKLWQELIHTRKALDVAVKKSRSIKRTCRHCWVWYVFCWLPRYYRTNNSTGTKGCKMNEIEFDIKDLDNETRQEIAGCINEGDGFWYCLNEGYIDPEKILADKEQLNKLKEALQIVRAFESLCNEIAEDYEEEDED